MNLLTVLNQLYPDGRDVWSTTLLDYLIESREQCKQRYNTVIKELDFFQTELVRRWWGKYQTDYMLIRLRKHNFVMQCVRKCPNQRCTPLDWTGWPFRGLSGGTCVKCGRWSERCLKHPNQVHKIAWPMRTMPTE